VATMTMRVIKMLETEKTTSTTLLEVQSRHYDNCSMWNNTHDRLMLNRKLTVEELEEVKEYFKKDNDNKSYFDSYTPEELKEHYSKDREERNSIYLKWKEERVRRIERHFNEKYGIYCMVIDYDQTVEIYDMYEW